MKRNENVQPNPLSPVPVCPPIVRFHTSNPT
jgi:hypothetical protein